MDKSELWNQREEKECSKRRNKDSIDLDVVVHIYTENGTIKASLGSTAKCMVEEVLSESGKHRR